MDTTYELPISFEVTKASEAEQPMALSLLNKLEDEQPLLLDRAEYFMADRGYDDSKLHRRLWDRHAIKPVIDIRNLWKKPEGHDATRAVSSLKGVAHDFEGKLLQQVWPSFTDGAWRLRKESQRHKVPLPGCALRQALQRQVGVQDRLRCAYPHQ